MKCVILAAGASTRMRPMTDDMPKCLLAIGGKPILQRTIENVFIAGAQQIGIVVGYQAAAVRALVKEKFPFERIRFITNPKFETTNNAFSLLMAREFFKAEQRRDPNVPLQQLLLLDSDIVFSPNLIPFLIHQHVSNKIAVRVQGEHNDEEIRVMVDDEKNIVMIGKETPLAKTYGESVGIEIFSPETASALFDVLEERIRNGRGRTEFYEAAFQEMIDKGTSLTAVDVSEFPAAEIDTLQDFEFAENAILPKIE